MDILERINRAFGSWYEGLFGNEDVRPRDILRLILAEMEAYRKEGIDGKTYVPNQYVLEISVEDEEEKQYLLAFLDREELETAIKRYCQQNRYLVRGTLDFTIKEVEPAEAPRRHKVRVRCRFDASLAAKSSRPGPDAAAPEEPVEEMTVPDIRQSEDEEGTVPALTGASLWVRAPGRPEFERPIPAGALTIGRSAVAGNDVVLDGDGTVSRRHARIEMNPDGTFAVYDLGTTNGTRVNGRKVDNRVLADGDVIEIGGSRLTFRAGGAAQVSPPAHRQAARSRPARLVLTDGAHDVDEFVLGVETLIGRGVTNDVVLPDRTVAIRHARIDRGADGAVLTALVQDHYTAVDDAPVTPGSPVILHDGARLSLGAVHLRFEDERP